MAATRTADYYVEGLNELLRTLRALPKEASAELRDASQAIADKHMVPAWKEAAMQAGPWGERIAATVRSKRDRVPAVNIGSNRRGFSGGATPTMVRYPSDKGQVRDSIPPTFGEGTDWIATVRGKYQAGALQEWKEALEGISRKWSVL